MHLLFSAVGLVTIRTLLVTRCLFQGRKERKSVDFDVTITYVVDVYCETLIDPCKTWKKSELALILRKEK